MAKLSPQERQLVESFLMEKLKNHLAGQVAGALFLDFFGACGAASAALSAYQMKKVKQLYLYSRPCVNQGAIKGAPCVNVAASI